MRTALLTLALAATLAACGEDHSLTGPGAPPDQATPTGASADARAPLDDAIARIVPALGEPGATAPLVADLRRVRDGEFAAVAGAEEQLARLELEDPARAADVDAVRLALRASR